MSDETYCYPPDFTVLRNRFGIRNAEELDRLEREFVATRMRGKSPDGTFDLRHLQAIHRYLFGERKRALANGRPRVLNTRQVRGLKADDHDRLRVKYGINISSSL